MDELTDEQTSYQEYQDLIKAIKEGADWIDGEQGNMLSVFHIGVLNGIQNRLDNPEYIFGVYHRTKSAPADMRDARVVWDLEVEYNGKKVKLRKLIERLELLWNEYRMLNDGGA